MLMSETIVEFEHATLARTGGKPVLFDLSWRWKSGETWAIVGPMGAGKSSLLEAIRGQLRTISGEVRWPILPKLGAIWPWDVIRSVSFKEESRLFSYSKHYYQQRFNFLESEEDLKLEAFLRDGIQPAEAEWNRIIDQFHLQPLLNQSLIQLSNGQTRRSRIAKALLQRADVLLLDDPSIGLDPKTREELDALLHSLIESGQRVLLVTRPEVIPTWVTNVLQLQGGRVRELTHTPEPSQVSHQKIDATGNPASSGGGGEAILELKHVTVKYGEKFILNDLNWTVNRGERWGLIGANGSGKSTLLSLIYADHPQAYANEVKLFGSQRGQGESIWEVKQKIGFLSPEFHLYFNEPLTVAETIATGFFDIVVFRKTTIEQNASIIQLLQQFDIEDWSERRFSLLSSGEQRLVLFLRALIKQPELLILDEPFQGFDADTVAQAKMWLDQYFLPKQTLIFVTHLQEEMPDSVTHRLHL
jgi:molybdate transport system ATP-binding protein